MRYRHRWLYVLVLLEFQSTVDRTMAVRVLAYTALLYQDLLRTTAEPLPPVLPIVLHHRPGRWTAAVEVAGVLGALDEWLSESGNGGLRRAVGEWMRQVYAPGRSAAATRPVAENQTEAQIMLRERVKEWAVQWLEEGRKVARSVARSYDIAFDPTTTRCAIRSTSHGANSPSVSTAAMRSNPTAPTSAPMKRGESITYSLVPRTHSGA